MSVNEKMTAIADAIRDKTKETEPLTLDAMAEKIPFVYDMGYVTGNNDGVATGDGIGYSRGYAEGQTIGYANGYTMGSEEGKKAEYDAFWDEYQQNGNKTNYTYHFSYSGWNSDTYNPKYPITIRGTNTCANMYAYSSVTDTIADITFTKSSGTSSAYNFMGNATNMVTIHKVIFNDATTFNNASFQNCTKLETMNVEGVIGQSGLNLQWSTFLNKASIESIIKALSDEKEGLTVTFSKTAVNREFGIDVDDPSTYPEGSEYYNLRHSKSKWNFYYA